jgi:hypothetical protein
MKLCCFGLLIPAVMAIICTSAVPVGASSKGKKGSGKKGEKSGKKSSEEPEPWCIRYVRDLRNLRDYTSPFDIMGKLNELGGDPDGAPFEKEGLMSLKQCEELKSFTDKSREEDLRAGKILDGDAELNDYRKDISPSYLVEMFGLETITGILEFFYESVGSKVPVTRSFLRRTFMEEGPQDMQIDYHTDEDKSVMIISLSSDGDYEGGELIYLNREGPHHVARTPGKAIVHNTKDVHGVVAHSGTRYTLYLWGMTEAECILEGTSLQEALKHFDPTMTQPN